MRLRAGQKSGGVQEVGQRLRAGLRGWGKLGWRPNTQVGGGVGETRRAAKHSELGGGVGESSRAVKDSEPGGGVGESKRAAKDSKPVGGVGETRRAAKDSELGGVVGETRRAAKDYEPGGVVGETRRAAKHSVPGGVVGESRRVAKHSEPGGVHGGGDQEGGQTLRAGRSAWWRRPGGWPNTQSREECMVEKTRRAAKHSELGGVHGGGDQEGGQTFRAGRSA